MPVTTPPQVVADPAVGTNQAPSTRSPATSTWLIRKTMSHDTAAPVPGGVTEPQERSGPEPSAMAAGDSSILIHV